MSYVDLEYYIEKYKGEPVEESGFPALCSRAEEIIEELTMYRVTLERYLVMPEALRERIKNAVCAQIEYMDANGGADMDNGADIQSAGLGKFNFVKASGTNGEAGQTVFSPRAIRLLAPTGLLYRGGGYY